jgi:hypothetical protein
MNQLAMKFKNNPEIAPSLLDYSIKVAEGTISVMSSTVILAGVSVPVCGIAAIVLFAYSTYAFLTANQLNNIVHGMNLSRRDLIELVTENPMLDDRRNPTEFNSNLTEEIRLLLERKESILETTPDDFFIIDKSKELQKILETLHEYFARAFDQFNPIDVEAINYWADNQVVRNSILSFFSDLNFSVSHLMNFTTIPQLNLAIS